MDQNYMSDGWVHERTEAKHQKKCEAKYMRKCEAKHESKSEAEHENKNEAENSSRYESLAYSTCLLSILFRRKQNSSK
jgi:hypothetical protein